MSSPAAGQCSQLLKPKHALVTGGARGIGLAITRMLLAHGARVTVVGRNRELLEQSAQSLKECGEVAGATADVSDPDAVGRAFNDARDRFGAIHILVNNAGQASSAPFLKTDSKLWRRMMSVNLDGTFYCTQAALPDLLNAGWGRVVNVASIPGLGGASYMAAYGASKHAVVGLTRSLAMEVAAKGITVNAVCPGYTETDMVEQAVSNIVAKTGRTPHDARIELASHNPQKRLVQPQEVANAVLWLCLPGSEAITGQAIIVAGGEVQ